MRCSKKRSLIKANIVIMMVFFSLFILLAPFIYPIVANLLIKFHIFNGMGEIKEYFEIFGSKYIIGLAVVIILMLVLCFSKKEILRDIISNINLKLKSGDKEFELGHSSYEDKKAKFISEDNTNKESYLVKKELQERLNLSSGQIEFPIEDVEKKILKDKNEELECNIKNIRFFSAYTITNNCSRKLLNNIYLNKKMEQKVFNDKLLKHYKNKLTKRMPLKKVEEYSYNKTHDIIFDLIFLDIIEYSEDDKYFVLTKNGIEFVEKYLKGDEGYGKFS